MHSNRMGFGDWINRKRHNRGFGIQSPSAFFFITQVLKERLPYYSYKELDRYKGKSRRLAKELLRITNYIHPTNCISIASDRAAVAMKAARPAAPAYSLGAECIEEFAGIMAECGKLGMLYIGESPQRTAILEKALQHTDNHSAIVIEGIGKNRAARSLWQQVIEDPRTIVTYDMHSYGLLLFDNEKKKQNYKLKR